MRLDPHQLEALCTQLCGALILPGRAQYDVSRISVQAVALLGHFFDSSLRCRDLS